MKQLITTILFLSLTHISFSQELTFQAALDSGKAEFKRQTAADTADFSKACQLLQQAVDRKPGNAEARYFLGYAIDRMNAEDGSKMNLSKKELTLRASEQFEMVNKLDPHYKGELWILDPYSKLSTIWGSLAMSYLTKNKIDSSKWAFRNGKERGGFIEPVLEFNRQLLRSCATNAILISTGDNLTITMWYLQEMEHLRTDITVIDAHMIAVPWYVKHLKYRKDLAISFSDAEIDTINYLPWKSTNISIDNPQGNSQGIHINFNWVLKPTYYDQYILRGDRLLLDIVKQNLYKRPFYFTQGSDSTYNLFLDDRFTADGIVDRLIVQTDDDTTSTTIISANLSSYSIDKLNANDIKKSKDAIFVLNGFRWAYYTNINFLYKINQFTRARVLLNEMDRKFPIEKLPYSSDYLQQAIEHVRQLLSSASAFYDTKNKKAVHQ